MKIVSASAKTTLVARSSSALLAKPGVGMSLVAGLILGIGVSVLLVKEAARRKMTLQELLHQNLPRVPAREPRLVVVILLQKTRMVVLISLQKARMVMVILLQKAPMVVLIGLFLFGFCASPRAASAMNHVQEANLERVLERYNRLDTVFGRYNRQHALRTDLDQVVVELTAVEAADNSVRGRIARFPQQPHTRAQLIRETLRVDASTTCVTRRLHGLGFAISEHIDLIIQELPRPNPARLQDSRQFCLETYNEVRQVEGRVRTLQSNVIANLATLTSEGDDLAVPLGQDG